VKQGQYVLRGQPLGECNGLLYFGVWTLQSPVAGDLTLRPLEPSAWLASRGYKVALNTTKKGDLWCEAGRKIAIPPEVHSGCQIGAGESPRFALLPISVREA